MEEDEIFEALHDAVQRGDRDFVAEQICNLPDKDRPLRGYTLVMRAAQNNDPEMVELLAEAGASVEVDEPSEWSALSVGITNSGSDAALKLIELGAHVDFELRGQSLFKIALYHGDVAVARKLVEVGARPVGSWDESSLLVRAVEQANSKLLAQMGKAGAFESVPEEIVEQIRDTLEALPEKLAAECTRVLSTNGIDASQCRGVDVDLSFLTVENLRRVETLFPQRAEGLGIPLDPATSVHLSPGRAEFISRLGTTRCIIRCRHGEATLSFRTDGEESDTLDKDFVGQLNANFQRLLDRVTDHETRELRRIKELKSKERKKWLQRTFLPFVRRIAGKEKPSIFQRFRSAFLPPPQIRHPEEDPLSVVQRVQFAIEKPWEYTQHYYSDEQRPGGSTESPTLSIHLFALRDGLVEARKARVVDWKVDPECVAAEMAGAEEVVLNLDVGNDSHVLIRVDRQQVEAICEAARAAHVDLDRVLPANVEG